MPYRRLISDAPPDEAQMNEWEGEGWSNIQIIGPCPAMPSGTQDRRMVYVTYLYRSIIEAGQQVGGRQRNLN